MKTILLAVLLACYSVTAISDESIVLSWDPYPPGAQVTHTDVQGKRSTTHPDDDSLCNDPSVQWNDVGHIPVPSTTHTDPVVVPSGTQVCYQAFGFNPDQGRGVVASNFAWKRVPFDQVPPAPPNLRVTATQSPP